MVSKFTLVPAVSNDPNIKLRELVDGRRLPELEEVATVCVRTRCPEKYVLIDLEDSSAWGRRDGSWQRLGADQLAAVRAVVSYAYSERKNLDDKRTNQV